MVVCFLYKVVSSKGKKLGCGGKTMKLLENEKQLGEFAVGDKVVHNQFGEGVICSIHENGILALIKFGEEEKQMNMDVLVEGNIIRKAEAASNK